MKKNWALFITLMLATTGALAFTKQEILDYTVKRSLVRYNYSEANVLEKRSTEEDSSREIADFAAQLLTIKLKESAVNVKEYKILMHLVKARHSTRYRNVFQSVLDANKSYSLNELAKTAIEELEIENPKYTEDPFAPTTDSFLDLKRKLEKSAQLSSPIKNWDEKKRKDLKKQLKKMDNMEQVYNLLGFPDNIDITFKYGRTGATAVLNTLWQNRFRVVFARNFGRRAIRSTSSWGFLNSLDLNSVEILDDYSNDIEVEKILTAKDPKQAKKLLKSMNKNYTLSEPVLSTVQQVVEKNIANFDSQWTYNLILMCRQLGQTKDPKYIDTLHKAAYTFEDDGLKSKTRQALYQLLTETDSTEKLIQELNSQDSEVIRLTTRAIYRHNILTSDISKRYLSILQNDQESEDKLLNSAMVTMLKTFSNSERIEFLPELKSLREQLKNKDLIAHADKAISELEKTSNQINEG